MILGVVRGRLYSTIHHPFYGGRRMLIVDRIRPDGSPDGGYLVAVDSVGAGAGETVLVIDEGNSARQVVGDKQAPLRSIIIGIVDDIHVP
ncbi:MAG: EutN/CcmL family microcompartment protein [Phycisphaerae bacterium]